jgi:hypothetical protein
LWAFEFQHFTITNPDIDSSVKKIIVSERTEEKLPGFSKRFSDYSILHLMPQTITAHTAMTMAGNEGEGNSGVGITGVTGVSGISGVTGISTVTGVRMKFTVTC